jgi:hypothetical protein
MAPLPPRPVALAGLRLRRALLRAADALLPTEVAVWEHSMGIGATHVVATLGELGVPDALGDGRATARELAPCVGADADALHRVLRAAATLGYVRMDRRGRVRLTRLGRALRTQDPHTMRAWARYMGSAATAHAWAGLTRAVRTGEPAFAAVHGRSVWAHFADHPDEEACFAEAMRRLTELSAPDIVATGDWPRTGTVCDVAGGVGTLLAAVLRARPQLRGVLVDAPGVLAQAGPFLRDAGVAGRVDLVPGDVFARVDARADVYVLKDVLHDWDDARCAQILATVRAAMAPGARLVLAETLQERDVPPRAAALEDLQMLTQCDGGRQRSAPELQALLRGAGLEPAGVREGIVHALVEGVAP